MPRNAAASLVARKPVQLISTRRPASTTSASGNGSASPSSTPKPSTSFTSSTVEGAPLTLISSLRTVIGADLPPISTALSSPPTLNRSMQSAKPVVAAQWRLRLCPSCTPGAPAKPKPAASKAPPPSALLRCCAYITEGLCSGWCGSLAINGMPLSV